MLNSSSRTLNHKSTHTYTHTHTHTLLCVPQILQLMTRSKLHRCCSSLSTSSRSHTHTHTGHTLLRILLYMRSVLFCLSWREGDKRDIGQGEDREREREKHLLYSL